MPVTEGTIAFANMKETEKFNGQDTGAYSVVLTLDDAEADKLEAEGVKIKMYQNTAQRKFKTKYDTTKIVDVDGEPTSVNEVRYGAKVRVKWSGGKPHPVHGITPYLQAIRVVETAADFEDEDF